MAKSRGTTLLNPRFPFEDPALRLFHLLASGGMGEIFETPGDPETVVKVLKPSYELDEVNVGWGIVEAYVLQALTTIPGYQVAPLFYGAEEFEWEEDGNTRRNVAVRMQRIEGETLDELVHRNGPLPDRIKAAADSTRGLGCMERLGLIHRDLKPENILYVACEVPGTGLTYLIDFAITYPRKESPLRAKIPSAILERLERKGSLFGTPSFMAPEEFTNIDLSHIHPFKAAVVLVYAITGINPLEAAAQQKGIDIKNLNVARILAYYNMLKDVGAPREMVCDLGYRTADCLAPYGPLVQSEAHDLFTLLEQAVGKPEQRPPLQVLEEKSYSLLALVMEFNQRRESAPALSQYPQSPTREVALS